MGRAPAVLAQGAWRLGLCARGPSQGTSLAPGARRITWVNQRPPSVRCTTGIPLSTLPLRCSPSPCIPVQPLGPTHQGWDKAGRGPCHCSAATPHSDTAEEHSDTALCIQSAMGYEAAESTVERISNIKISASANSRSNTSTSNTINAGANRSSITTTNSSNSIGKKGSSNSTTSTTTNSTSTSNSATFTTSDNTTSSSISTRDSTSSEAAEQVRLSRTAFRLAEKRFKLVKEDRDAPRHQRRQRRRQHEEQHRAEIRCRAVLSSSHTVTPLIQYLLNSCCMCTLLYTLVYMLLMYCSPPPHASLLCCLAAALHLQTSWTSRLSMRGLTV